MPPEVNLGRPAIYCNKTVRTWLRIMMNEKSNVHLSLEEVASKKVLAFDGIPVRRCDKILNSEATIS
jgi:hypothetical protein